MMVSAVSPPKSRLHERRNRPSRNAGIRRSCTEYEPTAAGVRRILAGPGGAAKSGHAKPHVERLTARKLTGRLNMHCCPQGSESRALDHQLIGSGQRLGQSKFP